MLYSSWIIPANMRALCCSHGLSFEDSRYEMSKKLAYLEGETNVYQWGDFYSKEADLALPTVFKQFIKYCQVT